MKNKDHPSVPTYIPTYIPILLIIKHCEKRPEG